jgi:pilus assembly protein CpaF
MEGETIVMTDIFKFEQTGLGEGGKVLGELKATGMRPLFSPRVEATGFKLNSELFGNAIVEPPASHQRHR